MHDAGALAPGRIAICLAVILCAGCSPPPTPSVSTNRHETPQTLANGDPINTSASNAPTDQPSHDDAARVNLGLPSTNVRILVDSYHAHNFLDRGLAPGETDYHRMQALRRAVGLLESRGAEIDEMIVGPLTAAHLNDVQLLILNLPSMDRPTFLVSEVALLEQYVRQGGGILFITDHSNCYYHQFHLLPLWDRLGITATFETVCDAAPANRFSSSGPAWIVVNRFERHPITAGLRFIGIQTGGRVLGEGSLAWTSDQAWADIAAVPMYGEGSPGLLGDLQRSQAEEQGRQAVLLARQIDRGRIAIIADQNCVGDCMLSYGDNWQMWLAACQWTSQASLNRVSTASSKLPRSSREPAGSSVSPPASEFERVLRTATEHDAALRVEQGDWQIECWEPQGRGEFRWGGIDPEQLYYLWCWMNRWYWVSAYDQPNRRPPETQSSAPVLLWIVDSDLEDPQLLQYAKTVLTQGGKVIVLPARDPIDQSLEIEPNSSETAQPESHRSTRTADVSADAGTADARAAQARDHLQRICERMFDQSSANCLALAQWHDDPIGHWHLNCDAAASGATKPWPFKGNLVFIPDARMLRNAHFDRPEISSSASTLKWQSQLHRWLFNQP